MNNLNHMVVKKNDIILFSRKATSMEEITKFFDPYS